MWNLEAILAQRIHSTDDIGWLEDGRLAATLPHTPPDGAWRLSKRPQVRRRKRPGACLHGVRLPFPLDDPDRRGILRSPAPRQSDAFAAGNPLPQDGIFPGRRRRVPRGPWMRSCRISFIRPPLETGDRHRRVAARDDPSLAAAPPGRAAHQDRLARPGLLPPGAGRVPRQAVHPVEVPHHARERRNRRSSEIPARADDQRERDDQAGQRQGPRGHPLRSHPSRDRNRRTPATAELSPGR